MTTPAELAVDRTSLDDAQLAHVQRLLGTWGMLADLSFSDLLLMAPVSGLTADPTQDELVVLGQMRPSNAATVVQDDLVGEIAEVEEWPMVARSLAADEPEDGEVVRDPDEGPIRVNAFPVCHDGHLLAALVRLSAAPGRRPGHLERTYRNIFDRFAVMLAESTFPFPSEEVATEEAPRVGDGLVLTDEAGRVRYASPNATNALHRMGLYSHLEGQRLSELGIEESAIEWALASALPVIEEVERRPDVSVLLHCIPLIERQRVTGCCVLLRDVTDVRRLDRLLLSKDAAIREVHHRVKNNLQTISALLRLQARRLPPGGGRVALFEAERRVRSIAIVHEILSREPGDQVPFDEIVTSLIRMAEDSVVVSRPLRFEVSGELGEVPADVATPLAVVLAELVQNAIEHAFVEFEAEDGPSTEDVADTAEGTITVVLENDGTRLRVDVTDDGAGLPEGFDVDESKSLGLSIVRDLVRSQLEGTILMRNRREDDQSLEGTLVRITVPLPQLRPIGL
ncbi:MAG: PAS domain-containing sensor histidine kinase [Acidimicrobiales bacterium]|nr:PAS domain-containing sensor histidine kinase [Acidimicrobiales bacterium]